MLKDFFSLSKQNAFIRIFSFEPGLFFQAFSCPFSMYLQIIFYFKKISLLLVLFHCFSFFLRDSYYKCIRTSLTDFHIYHFLLNPFYLPISFLLILKNTPFHFPFLSFSLIGVQLFYNVVLLSTVQQSGVPCAIQQVLISYLFYTY